MLFRLLPQLTLGKKDVPIVFVFGYEQYLISDNWNKYFC